MDEQKLDFSLPQGKQPGNPAITVLVLLVVVLTSLTVFNLYLTIAGRKMVSTITTTGLSAKQAGELATKLAQRNLYEQAAKVWQDYLASEKLTEAEQAKVLFNTAALLEKAQKYGEGWVSYVWENPVTKALEIKCSFVKAATLAGRKVFVGSGIYGIPLNDCK